MPTIFDNIDTHFLENPRANGLRDALKLAYRGDFCVGYFNLRGWSRIDDVVQNWTAGGPDVPCRLLVGMQRLPSEELASLFTTEPVEERVDSKRVAQLRRQIAQDFRKQLTIGIPTGDDEAGLRRLARQLREGRLVVKLFLRHALHAKLYLAHRKDTFTPLLAYVGSSNLTLSGLRAQGELNVDILEQDAAIKLHRWFEDRWADTRCLDITEELIAIIEESWAGERLIPPHHIYLKIAWHLSQDARDGIKEFRVPHDIAGELLPFQVKAVQLACRHLNKRGGVLVGDVVGLGKTRVACAIARVMGDDQMLECLILAPKNLVTMWENYAHQFGLRAPKVMSQTRALRELAQLPRYRLVVIDESHNFRNREGRIYQAIRDYLERNDCRVVLLSATPYNKTYLDLANQLRLFLPEQSDLGIRPESMLRIVGETEFSLQNPNVPLSSLAAFEKSEQPDDWREVMRLFLVRRTRSFIVQNYAETDERNGRKFLTLNNGIRAYFPQRVPRTVPFASDSTSPDDPCARLLRPEVLGIIEGLELPRYGLSGHLKPTPPPGLTAIDIKIVDDLSRAGRRLMGFCKTNLFKRLESSGHAFLLSLHRHILRNYLFLHALKNNLPLPIGQPDATTLDTRFGDEGEGELTFDSGDDEGEEADELPAFTDWDATHYEAQAAALYQFLSDHQRRRYRWLRTDVFRKTLATALRRDADALHGLLAGTGAIPPSADQKLQALINLVGNEHLNQKFLLFTQFADTAYYLERELKAAGIEAVDCATGHSPDPARQAWQFSPESNAKLSEFPSSRQTRILIATDVLSEGQNLQDAARVINYDLPWAIIRLVQRAGRVDRIGQQADAIICYSFLPAEGVEAIIRLRERLQNRLQQNAEVVGSDESFFEHQTADDAEALRRLYNEQSGILDEPADDEVDLTSEAYEIWAQAIKEDPAMRKAVESLPDVVFSTKFHTPDPTHPAHTPEGVLTYIRTRHDTDALVWIDPNGHAVSESPVRILRAAACTADNQALPRRDDHHVLVAAAAKLVLEERRDLQSGQLGSRRGARYRAYERLQDFLRHREGDLFLTDAVRAAIQAIYDHPLTTEAVDKLNRQLRTGISDDDLAALVTTLHRDDRLVIANLHDHDLKEARILCSLGLRLDVTPQAQPIDTLL
ncbi:helicase-related protein [Oleiharenicola lentus]|uniref:helicase-related protein n=1 Tax=Oleiharenicola lentus TaxID=2508720 RepID=UPI003F67BED4